MWYYSIVMISQEVDEFRYGWRYTGTCQSTAGFVCMVC